MGDLFGTDGVRGTANTELTPELAYALGRAGAHILCSDANQCIVVGKDTRISGDMLEAALMAGICSVGVDAVELGIIPTPGVAHLTRFMEAGAGVMISASHNPVGDNGIKFFDQEGFKLGDAEEEKIEKLIAGGMVGVPKPVGINVGRIYTEPNARENYVSHVVSTVNDNLKGLRLVVDCAFGAAWETAPLVLRELGADVIPIHVAPDGTRINVDCGSTNTKKLAQMVSAYGADVGIAHDGDADRVILVDENGDTVDGDAIMVICALHFADRGRLNGNKVVVTVMSNLGLDLALKGVGIEVFRTPVGDKYVLRKMLEERASLGGEQSGHIIFSDYCTTGDGLITACQTLRVMKEMGEPLSVLSRQMQKLPQTMINVRVKDKEKVLNSEEIQDEIKLAEDSLNGVGRVLVRPSGTEPLVRVMVESPTVEQCRETAERLAARISDLT